MCEQNASYFANHFGIRVKKFKQHLPENYSKSTKIAITECRFSKIIRGSMPPDLPRAFNIPNYEFVFSSPRRNSGGVGVYISTHFNFYNVGLQQNWIGSEHCEDI